MKVNADLLMIIVEMIITAILFVNTKHNGKPSQS